MQFNESNENLHFMHDISPIVSMFHAVHLWELTVSGFSFPSLSLRTVFTGTISSVKSPVFCAWAALRIRYTFLYSIPFVNPPPLQNPRFQFFIWCKLWNNLCDHPLISVISIQLCWYYLWNIKIYLHFLDHWKPFSWMTKTCLNL